MRENPPKVRNGDFVAEDLETPGAPALDDLYVWGSFGRAGHRLLGTDRRVCDAHPVVHEMLDVEFREHREGRLVVFDWTTLDGRFDLPAYSAREEAVRRLRLHEAGVGAPPVKVDLPPEVAEDYLNEPKRHQFELGPKTRGLLADLVNALTRV